jgi:hypothetical protein
VIRLSDDGADGALAAIGRISNLREGTEYGDPHAVRVRRK